MLKKHWPFSREKSQVSDSVRPKRPDISIITAHIKEVFYNRAHAEYIGGTLTFRVNPNGDDNYETAFCNFSKENVTPEYLFWLAMCYIKNKTPRHSAYERAQEIITEWPDQAFVAKELLSI